MQISKNSFVKAILSLCTLAALTACNLPSPQEKPSDTGASATFTAQAMADRSKAMETSVQGSFALPAAKVFNLQACLKDIAYDKLIAGHDFMIEELNKKVTSDKAGCLTWAETVDYNFLGESQYIRIERHIKGLGLHKGSQVVAFAINPWSHGENLTPVLNPDDGNSIPRLVEIPSAGERALKGFSTDNKASLRSLWVEDGRLFITEHKLTQDGVNLQVEVRPNPSIQMTKMNGEIFLRPLTAGSFKVRLKLIHSYLQGETEVRRQLSESALMDAKMENGTMAIKALMSLPTIPTRGQITLGLELQPIDGPTGLTPFEGIYLLGEYDQIKGSAFLKLSSLVAQKKDFKLSNYISTTLTSLDADTYQKPKIEVAQLEFRFIRVGAEKTSSREVFYNVRACVRHGLDQKSTRSHTFQVSKFRQNADEPASVVDVKTDNNSCINWDESITFKYFDCQHYLKGFVQIENKDLGMKEKLEILVNPWESQGMVARDLRYITQSEKLILSCQQEARPRTQIMVDNFNYSTLSYNYSIDNYLNLTVTKKLQIRMDPRVLIYSSLANGRAEIERLRDGIYLLRLAVVQNREYDSSNTYVTSTDRLVNVLSGQINTDITLQTQDLKALGNRNNILVEIYPVDESKVLVNGGNVILKDTTASLDTVIDDSAGLESPTFIGPVTLNIDEASRPLRMVDPSAISSFLLTGKGQNNTSQKFLIQQVVAAGRKIRTESLQRIQARADKLQFAKESNLEVVNLKDADEQAPLVKALVGKTDLNPRFMVTKKDLQALVNSGSLPSETAQKLCAFWNNDYFKKLSSEKGGVIPQRVMNFGFDCDQAVRLDPKKFFQVERRLLIKEVGPSQYIKGLNQGLTVGTSFSLSTSHTTSTSRSMSIGGKLGLSKKFLDIFSIGIDAGYTMSWSTADSNSASNSISVNSATSMTVQQNSFKVRVNRYEKCAIVRLNPLLFMKDGKSWFGRRDYLNVLNPQLTDEEKVTATTRGLMICEGELRTQPLNLTENYYLVAQEPGSSQMQDNGDARNRNFFIALRSSNDFHRFVLAMRGETKMPTSAQKEDDPQIQATKTMEQLFQLAGPAYPGMFLVP